MELVNKQSGIGGPGTQHTLLAVREGPRVYDARQGVTLAEGCYVHERLPSGVTIRGSRCRELVERQVVSSVAASTSFIFVLEGELDFDYGQQRFRLAEGQGLAVHLKHTELFRRRLHAQQCLSKVHLVLRPDWWQQCPPDSPVLEGLRQTLAAAHLSHVYWSVPAVLQGACRQLLACSEQQDPLLRRLQIEQLASGVLLEVLGQLPRLWGPECRPEPASAQALGADIERVLLRLEHCLQQTPGIETLAREMGMSARVLQRRFKQQTGLSVFDYLRQRRLVAACEWLENTDLSIGEVAHRSGFNHVSNFTTAFKRRYGQTPASWRQGSES